MADTITSKLGRILGVFACDSISQSVISVRYYGIKHLCCLQSLCPRISEMLANIWPLLESSCTIFSSAHSVRIGLSFLKCLVFFCTYPKFKSPRTRARQIYCRARMQYILSSTDINFTTCVPIDCSFDRSLCTEHNHNETWTFGEHGNSLSSCQVVVSYLFTSSLMR